MAGLDVPNEYPTSVNVITINCWGLKYLAKHRNARLAEIGRQLALADPVPQIVGLQECWTQQDYLSIREQTKHILPHGKFYFSGIFGGGLAILSKWPIEESTMYRYPLNGRPTAFFRGDWFVGKGVACARIRLGRGLKDVVEVFCTHLHAPYEREPNDSYLCHRTAQAWDIAKLMRGAAERGHMVLGLGDFNMLPLSLAHRVIEAHAPVHDVWRLLYPESSLGAADYPLEQQRGVPVPDIRYNLEHNGATCDSGANTWRWDKKRQKQLDKGVNIETDVTASDPHAKRLDYIFFGSGIGSGRDWTVSAVKLGMTSRHPTLLCSLSDHFSVEASLTLSTSTSTSIAISAADTLRPDTDNPLSLKPSDTEKPRTKDKPTNKAQDSARLLPATTYTQILANLASYATREHRQRRWRVAHFAAALLASIACLIGIWWVPHNYVSFILLLFSTISFAAGVLDGLIGGLFVGSELRALWEFEWEVKAALTRALADIKHNQNRYSYAEKRRSRAPSGAAAAAAAAASAAGRPTSTPPPKSSHGASASGSGSGSGSSAELDGPDLSLVEEKAGVDNVRP